MEVSRVVSNILEQLQQLDIEPLFRTDVGPALSFSELEAEIRGSRDICLTMLQSNLVAQDRKDRIRGFANQLVTHSKRALTLKPGSHEFNQDRPNLAQGFRNLWGQLEGYQAQAAFLLIRNVGSLTDNLAKGLSQVETLAGQVTTVLRDAEKALEAAKLASLNRAVTNLIDAYADEADKLAARARIWGILATGTAIGLLSLLGVFLYGAWNTATLTISQTLLRATALGLSYGLFYVCLRTNQAYRHMEVVNRHRVNVGRSFDAFLQAQPSKEAKDVFAYMVSANLLAFGKSGLLPRDPSVQGPFTSLQELFKGVAGRKESE
jgi:hypothetical protein